jgi:hypothetical protein
MNTTKGKDKITNEAIIKEVADIVKGLSFGTIMIKVHNSVITQLEVTEKRRFDTEMVLEKGGGI